MHIRLDTDRPTRRRRSTTLAGVALVLVVLATACINNGTWAAAPAPVTPVQGLGTWMTDVSCVSEDWCLAVGSMGDYPLAQVWDGASWSVVTAPGLDGEDNTRMTSVACGTPTSCVATVSRTSPEPGIYDGVEAWDGERWHEIADGAEGLLVPYPSSCTPDGTCVVVDQDFGQKTLVWDGISVTSIPFSTTAPPWELVALDCVAPDLCVAATTGSLATWNGSTWSGELPGSDTWPFLREDEVHVLACSAVDDCLAVGQAFVPGATSATWDGSAWTEVALPAGVTSTGDLDCVGTSECLLPASGGPSAGMLAWNGSAWVGAPSPANTWAISCLPLWCLGVGSTGSPATPTSATYRWTNP